MKKLAPLAALVVAAAGAWAQSDCHSPCTKAKEAAAALASQQQDGCEAKTGCDKAGAELVAHQQDGCEGKTGCDKAGAELVAHQQDGCEGKTGCDKAGAELVAHQQDGCEGKTGCGEKAATQLVSFPADMPKMAYLVGDKETCCPNEAAELASHCDSTKVQYKVNQVAYTDQAEAGKAYAAELTSYLDRMTRVSFVVGDECVPCPLAAEQLCEKSGKAMKYKVGNTVFDCPEKAIRAAAMAYGKAQQVKMQYAVDGKTTACSDTFAKAKSCSTTKASYMVAGKETQCEIEAACILTTARIEAALAAAEAVARG